MEEQLRQRHLSRRVIHWQQQQRRQQQQGQPQDNVDETAILGQRSGARASLRCLKRKWSSIAKPTLKEADADGYLTGEWSNPDLYDYLSQNWRCHSQVQTPPTTNILNSSEGHTISSPWCGTLPSILGRTHQLDQNGQLAATPSLSTVQQVVHSLGQQPSVPSTFSHQLQVAWMSSPLLFATSAQSSQLHATSTSMPQLQAIPATTPQLSAVSTLNARLHGSLSIANTTEPVACPVSGLLMPSEAFRSPLEAFPVMLTKNNLTVLFTDHFSRLADCSVKPGLAGDAFELSGCAKLLEDTGNADQVGIGVSEFPGSYLEWSPQAFREQHVNTLSNDQPSTSDSFWLLRQDRSKDKQKEVQVPPCSRDVMSRPHNAQPLLDSFCPLGMVVGISNSPVQCCEETMLRCFGEPMLSRENKVAGMVAAEETLTWNLSQNPPLTYGGCSLHDSDGNGYLTTIKVLDDMMYKRSTCRRLTSEKLQNGRRGNSSPFRSSGSGAGAPRREAIAQGNNSLITPSGPAPAIGTSPSDTLQSSNASNNSPILFGVRLTVGRLPSAKGL